MTTNLSEPSKPTPPDGYELIGYGWSRYSGMPRFLAISKRGDEAVLAWSYSQEAWEQVALEEPR